MLFRTTSRLLLAFGLLMASCDAIYNQNSSQPSPSPKNKTVSDTGPQKTGVSAGAPSLMAQPKPKHKSNPVAADTNTTPTAKIDKAALNSLLLKWLDAQNSGDFAAYKALYATRFDGVKRSGKRTFRFNREGWLKDRKGMFKKPMVVQADHVAVQLRGATGKIRFVQTWTSGKYSDRGPKELYVVAETAGLRIYKEEMIQSLTAKKRGKEKAPDFLDPFYLVAGSSYIVFEHLDNSTPPGDVTSQGGGTAQRTLPPQFGKSLLRRYGMGDIYLGFKNGTYTKMNVTEIVGVALQIPHFGVFEEWQKNNTNKRKRGQQLWQWSREDNTLYAAGLVAPPQKDVLWAMGDLGTPPKMFETVEPLADEKEKVLSALTRSQKSRQIQKWFQKDGRLGKWHQYNPSVTVRAFKDTGKNRYVFAEIRAGEGCGDFYEYLSGYFNTTTGEPMELGAPTDFTNSSFVEDLSPHVAMDIDGDGFPEFIGTEKIMYKSGSRWFVHELKIPYGDCPC